MGIDAVENAKYYKFTHNNKTTDSEPSWGNIDKTKLPRNAHADMGEKDSKTTWKYPHHWIQNGGDVNDKGVYTSGTMYLHRGGVNAAWAAANVARSGTEASSSVKSHILSHRKALGIEKAEEVTKEDIEALNEVLRMVKFEHNSIYSDNEPKWSNVDKTELPAAAYTLVGDPKLKTTWKLPHHWIEGGLQKDEEHGVYMDGTLFLHKNGLNAAWAVVNGKRGKTVYTSEQLEEAKDHLLKHRLALGMDEELAKSVRDEDMNSLDKLLIENPSIAVDLGLEIEQGLTKGRFFGFTPIQEIKDGQEAKTVKNTEAEWMVPIFKVAGSPNLVGGIIYAPNRIDTWGHFMEPSEIERMANKFMKLYAKGQAGVDLFHGMVPGAGEVVQSYIVQEGDKYFPDKEGAWAVLIEPDENVKSKISKGEINAFSMAGVAEIGKSVDVVLELDEQLSEIMRWNWVEMVELEEYEEGCDDKKKEEGVCGGDPKGSQQGPQDGSGPGKKTTIDNGDLELAGSEYDDKKDTKKYIIKARELKNAYTNFISFVEAGANREAPFPLKKQPKKKSAHISSIFNQFFESKKDKEDFNMTEQEVVELIKTELANITKEEPNSSDTSNNDLTLEELNERITKVEGSVSELSTNLTKAVDAMTKVSENFSSYVEDTEKKATKMGELEKTVEAIVNSFVPEEEVEAVQNTEDGKDDTITALQKQIASLTELVAKTISAPNGMAGSNQRPNQLLKDQQEGEASVGLFNNIFGLPVAE